ncbi:unnamed protein product [Cylindrotheca closterium]|uniref:Translation initiation factor IF-3 n=1 Tax=Cylindrotheca closterium TaxID=2856 RepID=A0AAD2G1A5_9STRA|nr:unnamed protein product [Cylindrotheca closterium]
MMKNTAFFAALLLSSAASAFMPISVSPRNDLSLYARINRGSRQAPVKEYKPPMNDEIQQAELRVVTPNEKGKDEPLGVMSRSDALAKAKEMGGLDLVLVNPNSDPPVCKIVDYSKYRYMQEKKAKEVKKNSKASELKEVKMSYKIDIHDYDVRKKNALRFLNQGNRVKCTVMFRGREMQHDNLGRELLEKLAEDISDVCVKEGKCVREGRSLSLIISPRPEVLKKVNENRRAGEKAKKAQKQERQLKKAAAAAAKSTNGAEDSDEDEDEDDALSNEQDEIDLESDIESSLDDLFGSDDLSDDLFK